MRLSALETQTIIFVLALQLQYRHHDKSVWATHHSTNDT